VIYCVSLLWPPGLSEIAIRFSTHDFGAEKSYVISESNLAGRWLAKSFGRQCINSTISDTRVSSVE